MINHLESGYTVQMHFLPFLEGKHTLEYVIVFRRLHFDRKVQDTDRDTFSKCKPYHLDNRN